MIKLIQKQNTIDLTNATLKGEDGFSPVIEVEEIEGGHQVTITDANGTQSFTVMDGEDIEIENYYTKQETDAAIEAAQPDLTGYALKSEVVGKAGTGLRSAILNGNTNKASGDYALAEGKGTTSAGTATHAEGIGTFTRAVAQHVHGTYNELDGAGSPQWKGKYVTIVGNGEDENNRSNAHTLDWDGNAWFKGKVYVGGTSMDNATALDLSDYYTKSETDELLSDLDVEMAMSDDGEGNVTIANVENTGGGSGGSVDLSNYYTKDETYSKTEVDEAIANIEIPEGGGGGGGSDWQYTYSGSDSALYSSREVFVCLQNQDGNYVTSHVVFENGNVLGSYVWWNFVIPSMAEWEEYWCYDGSSIQCSNHNVSWIAYKQ